MLVSFSKKYRVLGKVGEGSFSEVMKCQDKETGALYAAKRLKQTEQSAKQALRIPELVAMRKLKRHPNIVNMIESLYDPSNGCVTIIFELMDMSLYEFLSTRKRYLSEAQAKMYLYQILNGLNYLHHHGFYHRDIKPENILIKLSTQCVKLADLGSVQGISLKPPHTEYIATRWYRSPECLLTTGYYGPKMDVWAVGCVFYEMLKLKPLFPGSNEVDQISKIHNVLGTPNARTLAKFQKHKSRNCAYYFVFSSGVGVNALLPHISESGREILRYMLIYDPDIRPNVHRLLEHSYFKDFREKHHMIVTNSCPLFSASGEAINTTSQKGIMEKPQKCKVKARHSIKGTVLPHISTHPWEKREENNAKKQFSTVASLPAISQPQAKKPLYKKMMKMPVVSHISPMNEVPQIPNKMLKILDQPCGPSAEAPMPQVVKIGSALQQLPYCGICTTTSGRALKKCE